MILWVDFIGEEHYKLFFPSGQVYYGRLNSLLDWRVHNLEGFVVDEVAYNLYLLSL